MWCWWAMRDQRQLPRLVTQGSVMTTRYLVQEMILQAFFLMQLYPNSFHASTKPFYVLQYWGDPGSSAYVMTFQLLHWISSMVVLPKKLNLEQSQRAPMKTGLTIKASVVGCSASRRAPGRLNSFLMLHCSWQHLRHISPQAGSPWSYLTNL